jgi:hypothetical protein
MHFHDRGLIEDAAAHDLAVENAPTPIRALFREYEASWVIQALTAVGLNDDPLNFTVDQIAEGAAQATILLDAERRRRQNDMLNGR